MKRLLIAFAFIPNLIFASPDAKTIQFNIIKEAVIFYCSDVAAFPAFTGNSIKCTKWNYDCLKKYCDNNNLTNVSKKIAEWSQKEYKSKKELQVFLNKISDDITNVKDREYRKGSPKFKKFQENTKKEIDAFKEEQEVQTQSDDTVIPQQIVEKTQPEPKPYLPVTEPKQKGSMLPIIALVVAIIALFLSALNFFIGRRIINSEDEIRQLKNDVKEIKSRLAQKPSTDNTKPLEEKLKILENKITRIENLPHTVAFTTTEIKKVQPTTIPASNSQTKFAKLPDLDNGFSAAILLDNQNGEQIYEIELKDSRGTFSVSNDANAQKYALSDFNYYLSNACDYTNQPIKNCRIHTTKPGTLIKASGNWIIESKAIIEFR